MQEQARAVFRHHDARFESFWKRLQAEFERIFRLFHQLYGWQWDFAWHLETLMEALGRAAAARPNHLEPADHSWMSDPGAVWAMTYIDRFTGDLAGITEAVPHLRSLGVTHLHLMPPYAVPPGPNDGGYAVSDYRLTRPDLGTIDDLAAAIRALDDAGISVVLDFVANHTADDHAWAEAAKQGDAKYQAFYHMYDDRWVPDRYVSLLRPIFPDRGGDTFTWRADVAGQNGGKWVWTTFHSFQWDLDYRNPEVLIAMAGELFHLTNLGAAIIRMDATPFLWKEMGTTCENLDQAHVVLQLFNALTKVLAPGVMFLSEAVVHPADVTRFIRQDECPLGYNPLVMALIWEAFATGKAVLLADALTRRTELPAGTQWLTYLRCHDDIGWGFADEDAERLGIEPVVHRSFLNRFYAGELAESFSAGARFQNNSITGDARISGTLASLAGLERAGSDPLLRDLAVRRILAMQAISLTSIGIPLLYLGDEIGQLNDFSYRQDADLADDNRWMHRPRFDWEALAVAEQGTGPAGQILAGVRSLLEIRRQHPAFGEGVPQVVQTRHPGVLAYLRRARRDHDEVLVVVNLGALPAEAWLALDETWCDPSTGRAADRQAPLLLDPYEYLLLLPGRIAVAAGPRTGAGAEHPAAGSEKPRSTPAHP